MKQLVVYYSRTGVTKTVGEELAKQLRCDAEEIISVKNRKGIIGYIISGKEAVLKKPAKIKEIKKDSSSYDIVIIGTPVWGHNMSSPIRTYLIKNKDKLKNVAFFCTMGSSGSQKTFNEMEKLSKKPITVLELKTAEVKSREYENKLKEFVKLLR